MALIRSVAGFQRTLDSYIAEGRLDSALRSIQRVADQIFCEPINTGCIFGSRFLDDYCQKIGAVNWQRVRKCASEEPVRTKSSNRVVYIASRLYATGGHTAVLADIIRLAPVVESVILLSGTVGKTDHTALVVRFNGITHLRFEYAPRGSRLQKLDWLQRKLLDLDPDTVWLFNHPQDSVSVAAVQPDTGYRLRFYHHADHHLCLGVHLEYADHIDPHPMGFHNCRDHLTIRGNRYLPLVVEDQGVLDERDDHSPSHGLTTCTAAPPSKINAPYFIQYAGVIPELLRASGGRHIHIGPLSLITRLRIRIGLHKLGLPESSFVYIPYVSSVWKALQEYRVDIYVASFPYGGGRTLIEAMGAGVAVALHCHIHSRLLSSFDLACEGTIFWQYPQDLYRQVQNADRETLNQLGRVARRRYEEYYREEILAAALKDWEHPLSAPPLLEGYVENELQQALDITCQVTFFEALHRFANRTLRRWKSSRA